MSTEYQDRVVQEVAACTCDRCQRRMTPDDYDWYEKLTVAYRGGFHSIFGDGYDVSIDLCQQCVKETLGTWLRITPSDMRAVSDTDTAHLLRSPANAAHLERSIAQLRAGEAARRLADLGGTQPGIEGAPRRRFGALAGNVSVSADFDAPLKIDEATVDRAARDNPDLPRSFVAETLQGLAEARAGRTTPLMGTDYNTDFILWANEQATLLRDGRLAEVDRINVAEELDTLARAIHRELLERLVRLLQNLLQWEYLSFVRLPAWYIAIQEERGAIPRLLADAPILRNALTATCAGAWDTARERASYATGLALAVFPRERPYSIDQTLDSTFWPGSGDPDSTSGNTHA